jgi:toxin HigB-1
MKKTAKPIVVKAEGSEQNSSTAIYQLLISEQYKKRLKRFLKQHQELISPYFKTTDLLQANPFHPSLRLHALSGKLQGLHSVSINLSYRITLEFLIQDRHIILINVGDHDAVY